MAAPSERRTLRAKFRLFSFCDTHHPLHLGVHSSNKQELFGDTSEESRVVAIWNNTLRVNATGSGRLLVTVTAVDHVDFETDVNKVTRDSNSEDMVLLCSQTFLSHYKININKLFMLKLVDVCPMHSVTLGAHTEQATDWAQKQLFSTGLLLSLCQTPVLIRKDDALLAPYTSLYNGIDNFSMYSMFDLTVLACEPVNQGILSLSTEMTIVEYDFHKSERYQNNVKKEQIENEVSGSPSILSDFAGCLSPISNSISGKGDVNQMIVFQVLHPGSSDVPSNETDNIPKFTLDCVLTKEKVSDVETLDDRNYVGLSSRTMKHLGLFAGSFVKLQCDCATQEKKLAVNSSVSSCVIEENGGHSTQTVEAKHRECNVERIAQVVEISYAVDDVAYILPILWFNLSGNTDQDTILRVSIQKSMFYPTLPTAGGDDHDEDDLLIRGASCSNSWSHSLPYASEVHIALVHSPLYGAGVSIDTILQKYFNTPRLVTEGDIIALATSDDPNFSTGGGEGEDISWPVVYFQVKQVVQGGTPEGAACLADTSHTSLFQDGSVHSFVPGRMTRLLSPALAPTAPGLTSHVTSLVSLLQPHVKPRRGPSEILPIVLLSGPAGSGKSRVVAMVAEATNLHLLDVNCHELCSDTSASTEAKIKTSLIRARSCAPCILLLRNIHVLAKDRDGHAEDPRVAQSFQELLHKHLGDCVKWPVVVMATTYSPKDISSDLQQCFLHHATIEAPDETTRRMMLTELLQRTNAALDVDVKHVAQRTAGLVLGDLEALINHAERNAVSRVQKHWFGSRGQHLSVVEEEDMWTAGIQLGQADLLAALDQLQAAHSDAIGAPKIPSVTWADVGGLGDVKSEILDTIQLPLQHPELFAAGLRRSGVLLYGPPGTGKTLLAKAVATECSLNFLSVKGPELINMYVGQSEQNVREVFERARSAVPCVIFFDELDSLAPNRGRSGDSGGVMDRVVSQLLAELDGLHKSCDVFVIGATNRPDLLDPALLRPGRFDKLLFLGVSEDKPSQLKILQALTRKFTLAPACDLDKVAEKCPMNLTGADFYALCSDAMLNAIKREISLQQRGATREEASSLVVEEEDFLSALANLVPSVSETELAHYKSIQNFLYNQKS